MKLGSDNPIGTNAHELPMAVANLGNDADEYIRQSQYDVLRRWLEPYSELKVYLPDTFGTKQFHTGAPDSLALETWPGPRIDSMPERDATDFMLGWWQEKGIDPVRDGKLLMPSDGLNPERLQSNVQYMVDKVAWVPQAMRTNFVNNSKDLLTAIPEFGPFYRMIVCPLKPQPTKRRYRITASLMTSAISTVWRNWPKKKGARVPFVYAHNVRIQNNGKNVLPFDGSSTVYNADNSIQTQAEPFTESLLRGHVQVLLRDREQETTLQSRLSSLQQKEERLAALMAEYCRLSQEAITHDLPEVRISANQRLHTFEASETEALDTLYQALVTAVKEFFVMSALKRAVIGLSGGSDSALVAKILVNAIGADNVYAVNMPTEFNSDETKDYAAKLAKELGIYYAVVPIQESYEHTVEQINGVEFTLQDGTAKTAQFELPRLNKEGVQARDRGARVLAALASSVGGVFTNNGNKSEFLAGYCTFYADLAGALAPIADLYKTQVWALMKRLLDRETGISSLKTIADSIPSAELSAEQSLDGGTGDPFVYGYHDKLWFALFEGRKNPEDILAWYAEGVLPEKLGVSADLVHKVCPDKDAFVSDLERIYKLLKVSVIKGIQAPPGIRVSRKGREFDMRKSMMQNSIYYARGYEALKSQLLAA